MKKIFALFPGQGSQKIGMGLSLHQNSDIARTLFARADRALGFPLSQICFEGPEENLTSTEITQPAILTVSTICYAVASALHPSIVGAAGHSLGEYSALVAADAIDFEDAVTLVHKRGRFMQQAVPAGEGKMVAVLGSDVDTITAALEKVTSGTAQIANDNAPGQIVIAGSRAGVDEFLEHLKGKAKELAVSAPFHCSLMKSAENSLRRELETLKIRSPRFPVISNFYSRPLSDPEEIRESLALQVCGTVRWVESMQYAQSKFAPDQMMEFGHGTVLTGLLKRIAPEMPRTSVGSLEELSAVMAA